MLNFSRMEAIEKGKVGQIGEIRIWGGKKYHKTAKGWRPVPSQEQKSSTQLGDVRVWGGKEYVKTEKAGARSRKEDSHQMKLRLSRQRRLPSMNLKTESMLS